MIARSLCWECLLICLGLFCIIPCIDALRAVDLRTVSFDVAPQEVSDHVINEKVCYFVSF